MFYSEQPIDEIYSKNERSMIEATVATNIFPQQAIEGFFKNRTVMITNDLLLGYQKKYVTCKGFQREQPHRISLNRDKSNHKTASEDASIESPSLESLMDMAKYFYFVNNKYISKIEAHSVSQRETARLFNIPHSTFNKFIHEGRIYETMSAPFSDFDIC